MYHRTMDVDSNIWGATRIHARQFNMTIPTALDWRDMGFVSKVRRLTN